MWFEAGILSRQPGFDSRRGKPQKNPKKITEKAIKRLARRTIKN